MARIDHEGGSILRQALRKEYPLPQYAVLYEVANGMSATFNGYADAIVMSLFPSRGLDVHGFEIKTSRTDWLRELKNPAKAEAVARHCDYFWLLTSDDEIASKEEVPATWGLYVLNGNNLEVRKRAKRLKPVELDRTFVGAMLRRAYEMAERERRRAIEAIDKEEFVRQTKKKAEKEAEEHFKQDLEISTREHLALKRQVEEFEHASGIKIDMWNGRKMGEAVNLLMRLKGQYEFDDLSRLARDLEDRAREIKRGADELKQVANSFFNAGKLPT